MTYTIRLPWAEEQRLISAVDVAARYYRETLFTDLGAGPRRYLTTRGVEHVLDRDSVWTVGYAPPGWTDLAQHLRAAGYVDDGSSPAPGGEPGGDGLVVVLFSSTRPCSGAPDLERDGRAAPRRRGRAPEHAPERVVGYPRPSRTLSPLREDAVP